MNKELNNSNSNAILNDQLNDFCFSEKNNNKNSKLLVADVVDDEYAKSTVLRALN